jgi:hypothetical protein
MFKDFSSLEIRCRMRLGVDFAQGLDGDFGVNLRGVGRVAVDWKLDLWRSVASLFG